MGGDCGGDCGVYAMQCIDIIDIAADVAPPPIIPYLFPPHSLSDTLSSDVYNLEVWVCAQGLTAHTNYAYWGLHTHSIRTGDSMLTLYVPWTPHALYPYRGLHTHSIRIVYSTLTLYRELHTHIIHIEDSTITLHVHTPPGPPLTTVP